MTSHFQLLKSVSPAHLALNSSFLKPSVYLNVSSTPLGVTHLWKRQFHPSFQTHRIALDCSQPRIQKHTFKDRSDCVHCAVQKLPVTSQLRVNATVCNSLAGPAGLALHHLLGPRLRHIGPRPPSHPGILTADRLD